MAAAMVPLCAANAASEQLRLLPSQYLVDQWTSDVGMPEETAAEMVRIPNDHLLIATAQGVVRFDGQRFRTLYPNLPKAIAHSIIWTPGFGAECMIVGYGVATVEDTKLALRYPMSSTSNSQRTIRRDRQQRLVVLTGSELYREDKPRGELKIWRRFPGTAQRMVEMDNGSWLVASGTDLYIVNDESPTPTLYHKLDARIETVVRTRSGVVYVGNSQGLFRNDPGQKNFVTVQTRFSVFAIAEGAAGELWIGTEKGLQRMGTDGQLQEFGTNLQLRPEPISTILFDEDGSIWGAYLTGGFFRLRIPRFVNWSVQEGLTGGVVQAVHHDGKGGAWITARRGVHHISATGQIRDVSGDWKALNAKQSVYFEAEHKLWVLGFWGLREVDTLTLTSRKLPLPPSPAALFRIYRRASGECWVMTVKGEVFKWRNGAWEAFPIEGMPVPDSTGTLVESPAGETWMAIRGAGFFRIVGQKAQALALDQPERLMVHAIYPDRSGNIWLGLDGAGIGLYENGRIRTLMVDSTAQMNSAYLIVEDTRGFLWFGLRRGLFRIPKQELLSYFRGTLKGPVPIARYSSQSGLPNANFGASTTVNHPVPADTLWLPQLRGLVRADAAGLHPNQTPPTPHIDNVLVDDVPYPIRDGEVKVPARAQRVTIGFHGTFLPVPGGVRYRYQLENFQQSPTGPYTQREATFTQLPPGQYVFRLWTANSDDVWNAHPLELRVQVAPAFYQTWTFRLAAAGLLCLAVYGAFAWRTRLLRRDNEILEQRVEKRTRELEEARIVAENAAKVKSEFLATMSHEIRTPLHGVLGTLELLAERPLDGEEREYVRTAKDSGEALLELLNDVLDLSRLEAGRSMLQPEVFAFPQLCQDVVGAFRHAATVKGLDLRLTMEDLPPRIVGDPARLRQILSNLVGNAIKFTDQGWVEFAVRATPTPRGTYAIRFSVNDTGVGIDPEKFAVLFQPFSQVDGSSKRRYSGTGLGLTICQRLCEEMGGRIRVNSQLGKGAQFVVDVELPAGAESNPPAPAPDADGGPTKLQGRVLLVEDNRVNQLVASRMLTRLGCAFDIAVDGLDGVEHAARAKYAAILMDCHMPRATGEEATQMIRAGGGTNATTPIIALTADSSLQERDACLLAGMDGFLSKPYALAQLYAALSPHLAHASDPVPDLGRASDAQQ